LDYSRYTEAIAGGDREVFRDFMDKTMDSVFGLVVKILASEDDAKDIVQETYIKVWEKRKSVKKGNSLLSWTKRIALNKSYDYLRARKRRGDWNRPADITEMINLVSDFSAEDRIESEEYKLYMQYLTGKLSPKQQMVYTLAEIEKLPADEIEELTGLTKSSIKSNLYHARRTVQKVAERIL
jgi:RNA polymerase sigma-70 factor (ECF subfamily)